MAQEKKSKRYRPDTIREQGLRKHLTISTELGYNLFNRAMHNRVSVEAIRRLYSISRPTAQKWVDIWYEENKDFPKDPPEKKKSAMICAGCLKPIERYNKYRVIGTMLVHKNCNRPNEYAPLSVTMETLEQQKRARLSQR